MLSKSIVRELKRNRAVIAAYQFGSYGTKRHGPLSDVDVCLFTKELTSAEVLNLASYVSDKLDISIFDQLPMYIKPEVFKGKPLFVKNKFFIAKKFAQAFREYQDSRKYYDQYWAVLKKRLM